MPEDVSVDSASGSPGPAHSGAGPTRSPAVIPRPGRPLRPRRRARCLTSSRGGRCPTGDPPTARGRPRAGSNHGGRPPGRVARHHPDFALPFPASITSVVDVSPRVRVLTSLRRISAASARAGAGGEYGGEVHRPHVRASIAGGRDPQRSAGSGETPSRPFADARWLAARAGSEARHGNRRRNARQRRPWWWNSARTRRGWRPRAAGRRARCRCGAPGLAADTVVFPPKAL